jgi:hypothetical protein
LLRIASDMWSLLFFHVNFKIDFSPSVKNDIGTFLKFFGVIGV